MPRKDPFKSSGAVTFQLVHRSQRDPLIHDPEASQNIFKPLGQSSKVTQDEYEPTKPNEGEALKYGIYYDDSQYDYMQHLRAIGEKEDNVESILLAVPGSSKKKENTGLVFRDTAGSDIPDEFLPPKQELPGGFEAQRNIPSAIAGFRPDMNPHLRQTLEALEDDAFVDDGLEDDFFKELVADGEVADEDDVDFPFEERGLKDEEIEEEDSEAPEALDPDAPWEERFKQFKKSRQAKLEDDAASEDAATNAYLASEGGDTIGTLPQMSVVGIRKRRKKSGSEASGYTMSSSSMFRNAGLTLLDEQFERVLDEYENAHDIDCDCSDCDSRPAKRLPDDSATSDADSDDIDIHDRDDLEGILDEFLNKTEIIGRQLKPVMEGETWDEKLTTMRKGAPDPEKDDEEGTKRVIKQLVKLQLSKKEDTEIVDEEDEETKERWDCETILSTYSNMENHPRLIRVREHHARKTPRIRLDPKTGLPLSAEETPLPREKPTARAGADRTALHDEILGENQALRNTLAARTRGESKEDKAARKAAVKEQKTARRVEKKVMKETFSREKQHQVKVQISRQQGGVGLKKL